MQDKAEKLQEIIDEGLKTPVKKGTFSISSQVIEAIEKDIEASGFDVSAGEYLNEIICQHYGIIDSKIKWVKEYQRKKVEGEPLFYRMSMYANIDRSKNIEDLIESVFSADMGKVQQRRLSLLLFRHFEQLKTDLMNITIKNEDVQDLKEIVQNLENK